MRKTSLLVVGFMAAFVSFAVAAEAELSNEALEREHLSRYHINYASYLIDVGRYLEALESYNAAEETTVVPKTKVDALLAKATLLASFLDAPKEALKVYRDVRENYAQAAEIAQYRQGILLFDLQRYKDAEATLANYRKTYPQGRFRFQAEALLAEIDKTPVPSETTLTGPPPQPPAPAPVDTHWRNPDVRVLMCRTTGAAQIHGTGVCAEGIGCKDRYKLSVKDGRILVNGSQVGQKTLMFESRHPLKIICGSKEKQLRGKLMARIHKGKLMVVNVVDIEEYLLSVVPSENPASWPVESLKAQAVAARTYAYYQLSHRQDWAYDLVDDAGDQAYGGTAKEHKRSTAAVKATTGEILTYNKKPILAMFSANSGGYTADSQAVFDLHKPYLTARRDPESLKGSMANWVRKYSVSEVVEALRKINIDATGLRSVEAAECGPSGRIIKVRLVLSGGEKKVLRNRTTLRRALKLPEILHGIRRDGRTFIFDGHGYGHGVGYSQWGSAAMGQKKDYKEILSFYYGDARLDKFWQGIPNTHSMER